MMIQTGCSFVSLTAAQVRLLLTCQPYRGYRGIRPHGPQWKAAAYLKRIGAIEEHVVKHAGCSLGEFKLTRLGRRIVSYVESFVSPIVYSK